MDEVSSVAMMCFSFGLRAEARRCGRAAGFSGFSSNNTEVDRCRFWEGRIPWELVIYGVFIDHEPEYTSDLSMPCLDRHHDSLSRSTEYRLPDLVDLVGYVAVTMSTFSASNTDCMSIASATCGSSLPAKWRPTARMVAGSSHHEPESPPALTFSVGDRRSMVTTLRMTRSRPA